MTALVVGLALVIGIVFAEVLLRNAGVNAWPARGFANMRDELQSFRRADNDDARQHHLIRGGVATLSLSLAVLALIAVCAAVFAAPMLLLPWSDGQTTLYLVVSTVSAIAWWVLRRRRGRS
jgi:hypothetical protein